MKVDRYLLRGIVLLFLAVLGLFYEFFTDREVFVFVGYGLLAFIGVGLIWKMREVEN